MENQEKNNTSKEKLLPFILCAVIIILDQATKIIIDKTVGINEIALSLFGDFFQITHRRNLGVAFSLGSSLPRFVNKIIFVVIPILVIAYVIKVYMRVAELSKLQRWCICGIIGGGIGNLIDRVFRPLGVVDFLDVKWFGIENCPISFFAMERFPTFNIADSAVVVFGIILIISFIVMYAKEDKKKKKK